MSNSYDIIIIGAGVTGCAIARELSKYEASVLVLEKDEDICCGTSKANSGIIHAGYDAKPGSLKAKMNIRGNELMGSLAHELDIPFKRIGSLVVCTDDSQREGIEELYNRGIANGVPDMKILSREEVLEIEPNISDDVVCALYAPTAGIICPFRLNIALAECACQNGVEFSFDTDVTEIIPTDDGFIVETPKGSFQSKVVINAAGCHSDELHNQVSSNKLHITPRRGDYILLDRVCEGFVRHVIFPQPTKLGKGILVTPTVHGNTLIGPTATDTDNKDDATLTADGISKVIQGSAKNTKNTPVKQVITGFSGLRAHEDGGEFILEEAEDCPGFFDCVGIESPGLTACPAIGEYMAGLVSDKLDLRQKDSWNGICHDIRKPFEMAQEDREQLIREYPEYGRIICRCETITEGEIIDSIRRPLGARSLDGIKRRTRAGMGRCQGGFCSPRVMEIISRETGIPLDQVTKSGGNSRILNGRTKDES
ncbi:MAG: NAD(P)/FAD-dependent oxidoreductase [Clostridiales bacterium]|nr:NAD(P)/FAD-dependent oxidoreductase [Clostridiales bacterium]MBR3248026.1 NAD(P)/FAD-dependent oxidoreductase [Clostridiales bacterium]